MDEPPDWASAFRANEDIPSGRERGAPSLTLVLERRTKVKLGWYVSFAAALARDREVSENIPYEWSHLPAFRDCPNCFYAGRWTCWMFYFRGSSREWFTGKAGLDVGARTCVGRIDAILRGCETDQQRGWLAQTGVPHHHYYSNLGCVMSAIDIQPSPDEAVRQGDLRLLQFSKGSFDFATVPMIFGSGGTCRSFLDLALGLSELYRVLRTPGLAYIADVGFQPAVAYAAHHLGFAVLTSKGSASLPMGTFLTKWSSSSSDSFGDLFGDSRLQRHTFEDDTDDTFSNCNLLFDRDEVTCEQNAYY